MKRKGDDIVIEGLGATHVDFEALVLLLRVSLRDHRI